MTNGRLICAGPSALGRAVSAIHCAVHHGRHTARVPLTKNTAELVDALMGEGYVHTAVPLPLEPERKNQPFLQLQLSPALTQMRSVTSPGRNGTQYGGAPNCGLQPGPQSNGLRTYFVKTARGIMSQNQARRAGLRAKVIPLCYAE
ncbi:hypothetical protein PPROV_000173800 [Pycnococcus provasolii]|uniref:30S ribosomal protein S8, chloroplastic n=1 Tax=Pycnococcus provasolii TaxID=41880 RepID=A0A830H995_9CHLO|nr:hypothetical protein PPROV_000173800 [Pycnococcus provasolii]